MKVFKLLLILIPICTAESLSGSFSNDDEGAGCGKVSIAEKPNKLTKIPWTANLYLQTETQPDKTFAAVILSPSMILLNANLLLSDANDYKFQLFPYQHYEVRANITKYAEAKSYNPNVQNSKITHIRIHPDFNRKHWTKAENDVAIVHLQDPILFDSYVHSVCLPTMTEMKEILKIWDNSSAFVFISGWKRHEQEGTVLRMTPMDKDECKVWWEKNWETGHAKYSNRICANVSTENSHTSCINSFGDIGTFVRMNDDRFFFAGFVNNLYSDNRVCNSKTRYFISYNTHTILQWINNNTKCGPHKFTCNNGDCISLEHSICNKTWECSDGSDEDPEYCRSVNYCSSSEFACGVYGKCIAKDKKCDGKYDCENREDEEYCPSIYVTVLLVVAAVGIIFILIIISVVFWKKLKVAEEKLRNLTDEEVDEFEHGIQSNSPSSVEKMAINFPWDRHRFEIPKDKLTIEWTSVLGRGNMGIVYNGLYREGNTSTSVAVKTFESTSDVENLKILLSELKIMTKVGSHENIVNLIGAYTREIKQRILYMVVELCPLGCLQNYLKNNRIHFIDLFSVLNFPDFSGNYVTYGSVVNKQMFTTRDLLRWSYEIANGMEHLASINITHGDLATRNILLAQDFTAKISDFGLSRNVYESGIYIRKHMIAIPWKWMAIESLRDSEFSTQSDVWSFGVTIWEIFSLGCEPYPGLNWSAEFVAKLCKGLRMSQPTYGSADIYRVLLNCWQSEPSLRPEFRTLKEFFHELSLKFEQTTTTEIREETTL